MTLPHHEVAIIGAGITGLATGYFLAQAGIRKITLFDDTKQEGESSHCPGLLFGGSFENFSRISHAHGEDFAKELWQFGDDCFDLLVSFTRKQGVPHLTNNRLRLIVSQAELDEAQIALTQLQKAGFPAELIAASEQTPQALLAIQNDGPRGGWLAAPKLLAALRQASSAPFHSTQIVRISTDHHGVLLEDAAGERFRSQVVVLACHLGISKLLPSLQEVLVPVATQWQKYQLSAETLKAFASPLMGPGTAFSCNNTYEWGGVLPRSLLMGGGNYLRPLAGIGQTVPRYEEKIARHLRSYATRVLALGEGSLVGVDRGAGLEIRPCDELPVIGPWFDNERILVAAGFMGQGLTLGFNAGRCLAELIARGSSPDLPRRLWPERLRNLG